jgi:hypothetical protein
MWKDEIIEEIRKLREEHAAQFDYNIRAIIDSLKKQEQESGRTVVSFSCISDDNSLQQHQKA